MSSPVLYFFQLVLGVFSQFISDMTNKRIGFPQAFPQKGLKLVPGHKGKLVALYASLMLLPPFQDTVLQEFCSKKYAFMA